MTTLVPSATGELDSQAPGFRQPAEQFLKGVIEAGVLGLVCLSPWALGAADPPYAAALYTGLAVLLLLWGLRVLLLGRLTWQKCPVLLCLAGLFLLGACQLAPWPTALLERLSPATADLYQRLLPVQPETIAGEAATRPTTTAAGSTLSLYPHVTRQQLMQLLAALAAFALVRNNVAPVGGLRRLAWVALVNGCLLALFALVQAFTSPADTVYWSHTVRGASVFGPFLCRNHFAFYLNLCLGLGLGLLFVRAAGTEEALTGDVSRAPGKRNWPGAGTLGTAAALVLILGGIAFCHSPGGCVALLAAAATCTVIQLISSRRFSLRLAAVLLVSAAVLMPGTWLIGQQVEARLGSGTEEDVRGGDLVEWSPSLRWVSSYPLWGTGFGTFPLVEARQRDPLGGASTDPEGSRNTYVEALVEGGMVRLALSVAAIVLVFRLGVQACRRRADTPAAGLALGALFAFAALVVQSALGSGVHVPAIVLLASVLCADLCGLRDIRTERAADPDAVGEDARSKPFSLRLGGLGGPAGLILTLVLGMVLVVEAWKVYQVQRLQTAALQDSSAGAKRPVAILSVAARLAPGDARVHIEIADAHARALADQREQLKSRARVVEAVQSVLSLAPVAAPGMAAQPAWIPVPFGLLGRSTWEGLAGSAERRLATSHAVAELRHVLHARNACPLWAVPHLRLAANVHRLTGAEPARAYLDRARLVAPEDAEVWYRCGIQELADGQPEQAWQSWRRCLELSDLYLGGILDRSAEHLEPGDILNRVLPSRPALLEAAAFRLYPQPEAAAERRPFLEKGLALLAHQADPLSASDLHTQALIQDGLGQPTEAIATYEAALAHAPRQAAWRWELARLLREQGRLQEARAELLTVLEYEPSFPRARRLLDSVNRELGQ